MRRWVANSPSTLLRDPQRAQALSGGLYPPTVKFSQELDDAGIAHELVIAHGGHANQQERMAAIGRSCASKLATAR